jgi:tRNA A-37 threonylcarbamoyl transferase component Bud32
MATEEQTTIIETTVKEVLGIATKVNDLALSTTEKVFEKSFELTEKSIGLSSKIVKKGIKASVKKQDKVFETLETVKGKAAKYLPRFK